MLHARLIEKYAALLLNTSSQSDWMIISTHNAETFAMKSPELTSPLTAIANRAYQYYREK